ncbi:MAG: cyclic nucleotide-binding domain-containing protein [Desulfobacula sp.]|uniref:cyclic nucleotide-binding domain-containing protein n=1 Tax=Desulfobacula sp. TaxID=2593537 RepID=UPI0025B7CD99|nr:cyclic nucleotide-binding domain-containing protein [Desulfobacula sp.]MCD4720652.1 cyclic nucleotide-binding domain-containing protein [Desulfobacula sp.]
MPSEEIARQINELIDQNQKEKAVKFIFEMIVKYANSKQFNKAEKLREKLIQVDSMALNEIINSAEIIEVEKLKLIDLNHKKIWAALYDRLTNEEANAFYFALKKVRIMPAKEIIQQGKLNNKLFFIDQGILKVVYSKEGHELFLKNITKGETSGQCTFFSISVATASVISMEQVKLHFLEREKYSRLVEKFAGFDGKLEHFCRKLVKQEIEDILKKKEIERRYHNRYKASGKVAIYMLDSKGQPNKTPFHGMLENLSEGGLSFSIINSNRETARSYLGRFVLLKMISNKTGLKVAEKGIVLSVYNRLFNNYSISLKFIKPMSLIKMQEFRDVN